ncbi:hypothetical protein C2857_004223 [Epichloe festucae Fl1]|uniref:Catechol dioxygenase n=1 Tax=Epichloe festucae (strain Fl1) TaxID=877507 RepID=A0A7S9KKK8_EPIFF|nr:hypothetical protein C2857_004223 [Epichloe festucae Fl1]
MGSNNNQQQGDNVLGRDFTQNVIDAMGPNTPPRLREVMASLIKHVHDFAREVQLTTDEWMAGVQLINQAGQMSNDKRNEGQLLCDVIGLESPSLPRLYEQQDPDQEDHNLRGIFHTDARGKYSLYCLKPTPYPVPTDGPAGKLLKMMDRHVFRPAHIHLMVQAKGHKPLTTQIFDKDCKYLADDSVFAVKDELSVSFAPREGDAQAALELEYNVTLAQA